MRLIPLPTLVPILLSCSKGHFDVQFPYFGQIFELQLMKASKSNSMFGVNELNRGFDSPTRSRCHCQLKRYPHSIPRRDGSVPISDGLGAWWDPNPCAFRFEC